MNVYIDETACKHIWSRGGYSLCDGWYICAAVLTPFFHFGRIEHDLFGVFFLIHQHKNDLLGTNPRKIRSFWPQNTIFPSIFLGPIFSGPRHTPSNFRTEYPPRAFGTVRAIAIWMCKKLLRYNSARAYAKGNFF